MTWWLLLIILRVNVELLAMPMHVSRPNDVDVVLLWVHISLYSILFCFVLFFYYFWGVFFVDILFLHFGFFFIYKLFTICDTHWVRHWVHLHNPNVSIYHRSSSPLHTQSSPALDLEGCISNSHMARRCIPSFSYSTILP